MRRTPLSTADDRSLADAVAGTGDERAFRELYRRHTPALYQLVLRMLGGVAVDAEAIKKNGAIQFSWRALRQRRPRCRRSRVLEGDAERIASIRCPIDGLAFRVEHLGRAGCR